ncbi:MAG: hypothetical protein ACD_62C00670G0002 [uncultured bacterium]|nr:MAG: hypothetical protein ACD_62C00670G0002 [uncultured bacterium]HLD44145.1 helix-turn-helix transcriptional regulator [bacterium]
MDFLAASDRVVMQALGERIHRHRLNRNVTQASLALKAGVARIVIHRLENGLGCTLESFIRILRALGAIAQLDLFLPDPGISPRQLAKLKGHQRQRASGQRASNQKGR